MNAHTVGVSIARSAREVYEFVAAPPNFARWAAGLGSGFANEGGQGAASTPQGRVRVRFAERNAFGVVDHWVTLASGEEVYVPLRVVPNGAGSEVMLTVFRRAGMTDAEFDADVAAVRRDFAGLKALLEKEAR